MGNGSQRASQAGTLCGEWACRLIRFTAVSGSMKPLTALPSRPLLDRLANGNAPQSRPCLWSGKLNRLKRKSPQKRSVNVSEGAILLFCVFLFQSSKQYRTMDNHISVKYKHYRKYNSQYSMKRICIKVASNSFYKIRHYDTQKDHPQREQFHIYDSLHHLKPRFIVAEKFGIRLRESVSILPEIAEIIYVLNVFPAVFSKHRCVGMHIIFLFIGKIQSVNNVFRLALFKLINKSACADKLPAVFVHIRAVFGQKPLL